MAVARSDDGSGNMTRRRTIRRSADTPAPPTVSQPPAAASQSATATATVAPPRSSGGLRLDDLYRLPMPKLFALAEREGIAEHTGMNRAQLIVAVVRKQVERGEVVRG